MKFAPSRLAQRLLTYNDWMKRTGQANQQEDPAKPPEREAKGPEREPEQPEPETEQSDLEAEDLELELEDGLEVAGFKPLPQPKPVALLPNPREQRPEPEVQPPNIIVEPPKPEVQPPRKKAQPPNNMVEPDVQPPRNKFQPPEVQPPRLDEEAQEYFGPWRRVQKPEDDDEGEEPLIEESDSEEGSREIEGLDLDAEGHPEEVIRLRRKRRKYNRKAKHSESESEDSV